MAAPGQPALKRAVLVGAGKMGWAMARGWLGAEDGVGLRAAGLSELEIVEPHPSEDVLEAVAEGALTLNTEAVKADILVLAIKPQSFPAAALSLKQYVGADTFVVSVMAGVTIAQLSLSLGALKVARAMPNTPGAIGAGVTAFALSDACSDAESMSASRLLDPLGMVVGPLNESHMDAVTAVSGSGPAYVFLLAETLADAGIAAGLPAPVARMLARETITGAAALLGMTSDDPSDLRRAVTSPNGTTAAALDVLMGKPGMAELMKRAVAAAKRRGEELANEAGKA